MRVRIVVFAGVDEMDLIAPFEVLASIAPRVPWGNEAGGLTGTDARSRVRHFV